MRRTGLTVLALVMIAVASAGCRRGPSSTEPVPADRTSHPDKTPGTNPPPANNTGPASKGSDASTALGKESLLGQWKGTLQDGSTLELAFNENENVSVAIWGKEGGFNVQGTVYKIDSEKNEVKIWGTDKWGGRAKPTKDGALLVSGDLKAGTVPETRLERVKK
jgi:hypothetical protein